MKMKMGWHLLKTQIWQHWAPILAWPKSRGSPYRWTYTPQQILLTMAPPSTHASDLPRP